MSEEIKNNEDGSIPSPLTPFDYNLYREQKTNPAMKRILQLVAEKADTLLFNGKIEFKDFNERIDVVAKDILAILIEENVAEADRRWVFEYPKQIFEILGDNIQKQVEGNTRELLSRVIGTRNPGSGKFDVNYSNIGDLFSTLIKVRKETGDKKEDYFFINNEEEK